MPSQPQVLSPVPGPLAAAERAALRSTGLCPYPFCLRASDAATAPELRHRPPLGLPGGPILPQGGEQETEPLQVGAVRARVVREGGGPPCEHLHATLLLKPAKRRAWSLYMAGGWAASYKKERPR